MFFNVLQCSSCLVRQKSGLDAVGFLRRGTRHAATSRRPGGAGPAQWQLEAKRGGRGSPGGAASSKSSEDLNEKP